MILYKFYNAESLTEKAWYDSSMFYYTEFTEDPNENKGDLTVTFKNGGTYKYFDVKMEDYVLLIAGSTESSHGKALNKHIKPNYKFEKLENRSISELENELNELNKKEDVDYKSVTYFISGHRDISEENFEKFYKTTIDSVLDMNPECRFVVGDCEGVDIMAQDYLIDARGIDPEHITVYHMYSEPRNCNKKITKLIGGFQSDSERDSEMTKNSFNDIAFVRDWRKLSGTAQNILRRYHMN